MAKFFNKILDYIGLEEEFDEEEAVMDVQQEAQPQRSRSTFYQEEQQPQQVVSRSRKKETKEQGKVLNMYKNNGSNTMIIFRPSSCEDASTMIDSLKCKKPVIANFETIDHDQAQRILDIMSGAMYALCGTVHKVSGQIYVFAPDTIDVSGDAKDSASVSKLFADMTR